VELITRASSSSGKVMVPNKNVVKIAAMVADHYGMDLPEAKKWGMSIREDSNGWSECDDSNALGFIMWEEGPEGWTEVLWDLPMVKGAYSETICGWGLVGVYPA